MKLVVLTFLILGTSSCKEVSEKYFKLAKKTGSVIELLKKPQINGIESDLQDLEQFNISYTNNHVVFESEYFKIAIETAGKNPIIGKGSLWKGFACSTGIGLGCCQTFYKRYYDAKFLTPSANEQMNKAKEKRRKTRDEMCAKNAGKYNDNSFARIGDGKKAKFWVSGATINLYRDKKELKINKKSYSYANGKVFLRISSDRVP